jgi:hypothetical protein
MTGTASPPFRIRVVAPGGAVPPWVPPPGQWAEVPAINEPWDVSPPLYARFGTSFAQFGHFMHWCRRVHAKEYGTHGAIIHVGGGHESQIGSPHRMGCDAL